MEEQDLKKSEKGITDWGDDELMRAYQFGDERAFEVLYRRHSSKVFGYIKKRCPKEAVSEDIFQAVFLKLHKSRASYNPNYPFLPWFFTLIQSVMVDGIRKGRRIQETLNPVDQKKLEQTVANEEKEPIQLPDLSKLPDGQRSALELRYGKDLSFDEIADELKTSPSNVRQLVSRGIRRLKEIGAER
ncbi:MAG TPA: sigma-70 family RNA polymerase sigma factor [Bdellovibrionota bacterium]|nr:sigma-70 family RNA polymerase sigma factor [Bdellovibrionota bacterium]